MSADVKWEFWRDREDLDGFTVGANPTRHCPESAPYRWGTVCEGVPDEKTARLIAAAPDLLDACCAALTRLTNCQVDESVTSTHYCPHCDDTIGYAEIDALRAALTKAGAL